MSAARTIGEQAERRDYVVRAPRITDAIGRSLRAAYSTTPLPRDLERLLWRLDSART